MKKLYQIDTPENKQFLREIRNTLFNFGHQFSSPDGSSYYLGHDGTPWTDYPRETYVTSRMAHVYSIGSFLGYKEGKLLVNKALNGLCGVLHDNINGGWYSGLTADNKIIPGKLCYAHAFVILAATSAVLAECPSAESLLKDALDIYDRYFWQEEEGLSCDTWDTEFTQLDNYRGLNANMHTVEAFLAAADIAGLEQYRIRCGRIIDHVLNWASENNWRIPEHFNKTWEPNLEYNQKCPNDSFKPYGATPGHGMEWARLIVQWALSMHDKNEADAIPYIHSAENLYNQAVSDGWYADGAPGIVYTTDWKGKAVVHDRMHWTLAEAINTSAVLFRVTRKEKYANDYAQFMQYLDEKVLDHINGSCFHQMDQNNQVIGTVWPGKPDIYHALQATLIPYSVPDISIALAVKNNKFYG